MSDIILILNLALFVVGVVASVTLEINGFPWISRFSVSACITVSALIGFFSVFHNSEVQPIALLVVLASLAYSGYRCLRVEDIRTKERKREDSQYYSIGFHPLRGRKF